MKAVYLIRGWYWKRYWSSWVMAIVPILAFLGLVVLLIMIVFGSHETRDDRIRKQGQQIAELQQRVDSLSLQFNELKKK